MVILSQKTMPFGNEKVGFSKYLGWAYGSEITLLSEIMGITPTEINTKLKEVQGFAPDMQGELWKIIWDKIILFPGWTAQLIEPYDNKAVLNALSNGRFVITLTASLFGQSDGTHAVRYMGQGLLHDPLDGTEKPTSTYPDVKGVVIITKMPEVKEEPIVNPIVNEIVKSEEETEVKEKTIEILNTKSDFSKVSTDKAILKQLKKIHIASIEIKKLLAL